MFRQSVKFVISILMVVPIFGCAHQYYPAPDDPSFAPVIPDIAEEPKSVAGSAFIDGYGLSLYQDMKAHRVGDIITVKLVEETKASKDAKTNFKKTYTATTPNPTIFGKKLKAKVPSILPLQASDDPQSSLPNLSLSIDNENEFKGSGDGGQNNSLTGNITVTIAQVLPNKNLVIRGEKWLTLNQGSEYIRLTGVIRQQDIGPNNEILSNRIANARITYSGTGPLADVSKAGWLARFFNSGAWPF